jgi:hypothetical protein
MRENSFTTYTSNPEAHFAITNIRHLTDATEALLTVNSFGISCWLGVISGVFGTPIHRWPPASPTPKTYPQATLANRQHSCGDDYFAAVVLGAEPATSRLFSTLNAPGAVLACTFATAESISLFTTPYSVTLPFFTMMWMA